MQQRLVEDAVLEVESVFPRVRYMGSKYGVLQALYDVFSSLSFDTALDAFSGSGVVAYLLKRMGKEVTANDFLAWPATIATALIENGSDKLSTEDVAKITGPALDDRDFIWRVFRGRYFPDEDLRFLDAAWSHIARLPHYKKSVALAALCLAAAWKQPRGVFTITDVRYDDGRRQMHTSLRELFVEAVHEYNAAVFQNGRRNRALKQDVFDLLENKYDLVYLDPPYAPPSDDADYIKRYHFLEGLSRYWEGMEILWNTKTRKIKKRYTPFAYKSTAGDAIAGVVSKFKNSIIVLSYSSNAYLTKDDVYRIMRGAGRRSVDAIEVPHRYHFGTRPEARRRVVEEYIFVSRS